MCSLTENLLRDENAELEMMMALSSQVFEQDPRQVAEGSTQCSWGEPARDDPPDRTRTGRLLLSRDSGPTGSGWDLE